MEPRNPKEVMQKFRTWDQPITIIGCGGMGSRIGEAVARMALDSSTSPKHLILIDHDTYEEKNLRNQFITTSEIGEAKVNGLGQQLLRINQSLILELQACELKARQVFRGMVFVCVDSMHARRKIMQHCLESSPHLHCVIETRLDSGVGVSYCFDPKNKRHQEAWWMYWHPDDEAENYVGCGGSTPISSAIFGTTSLALKQFEHFLVQGTAEGIPNRVYQDFDCYQLEYEVWPT
jgi:hypothetical protein